MMLERKVNVTENRHHIKPAGRALKNTGQAEKVMAWEIRAIQQKTYGGKSE